MANKPHIILFNPDQWRGDAVAHMGNPAVRTPNLDRAVQKDFVSFSRAFCQNPVCTPSRCSFMTGWYPHVRGHRTMFHMLRPDEPCLLKKLKDNGYFVWWGGKNDLVPAQNGYDAYCDVKYMPAVPALKSDVPEGWRGPRDGDGYYSFYRGKIDKGDAPYFRDFDWAMIEGAIEFIRHRPKDKPLCIYLPLLYPHPPYGVEEPWFSMTDRQAVPPRIPTPPGWAGKPSMLPGIARNQNLANFNERRWAELRATYYGMCSRVDHQFGLLMEELKRAGIYDDSNVFLFSDHGDYTGDYGLVEKNQNTFEDCLTRVPFLVKLPAGIPVQPRISDALVELIDIPATVMEVAGIQPGYTHFGRSLLPLLAGHTQRHRDAVFCEGGRLHSELQCAEKESKQTEGFLYWPRVSLQSSDGPEATKAVMCRTDRFKYVRRLYESDELYDLQTDPGELVNRINDPALAEVLANMRARLLTFYLETSDVVPFNADKRW